MRKEGRRGGRRDGDDEIMREGREGEAIGHMVKSVSARYERRE